VLSKVFFINVSADSHGHAWSLRQNWLNWFTGRMTLHTGAIAGKHRERHKTISNFQKGLARPLSEEPFLKSNLHIEFQSMHERTH